MIYIKNIALTAMTLLLFVGCSKDKKATDVYSGKAVEVSLYLDIDAPIAVGDNFKVDSSDKDVFAVSFAAGIESDTRTMTTVLTNVWVLQFDNTGANISTTNYATIAAGAYLSPTLISAKNCTVYVVANSTVSNLSKTNPATIKSFENDMLYTEATTASKIPLVAKLSGVNVATDGKIKLDDENISKLTLARLQAEITLTANVHVNAYKLTSAQLFNVPKGSAYGLGSTVTAFPDNSVAANFVSNVAPISTSNDADVTTYKWFVGDNRRGAVYLTNQNERNINKAPAYSTFIRITLTSTLDANMKILYDIYLGNGTLVNFDVIRNRKYNITAKIAGANTYHESLIFIDDRISGMGLPLILTDKREDAPFLISGKYKEISLGMDYVTEGCLNFLPKQSWRSPSQSELILLWSYRFALSESERLDAVDYWSSTGVTSNYASNGYFISFSNGLLTDEIRAPVRRGRCITDAPKYLKWKYPRVDIALNTVVSRDTEGGIKEVTLLSPTEIAFLNTATEPNYADNSQYNKISPRFRVALANASAAIQGWTAAFNSCRAYAEADAPAGTWRLPTQRELMLMWVLKADLIGNPDATAFYWSGTKLQNSVNSHMWGVDVPTGRTTSNERAVLANVRCVRDVI